MKQQVARALQQGMTRSLRHIPNDRLYISNPTWWLESRFHFSYAGYEDPVRDEFGALRVLNDDMIQPLAGFGTHPHRDMELFTYIVEGEMNHRDSLGGSETLPRGSVQFLGAGTGMTHSEMNQGRNLLRYIQAWIKPDGRGYPPAYASRQFTRESRLNRLLQVASGRQNLLASYPGRDRSADAQMLCLRQDVNIYVSEADPGCRQVFTLERGRQAYVVCMEGVLTVNGIVMEQRDALEAVASPYEAFPLRLGASLESGAHFMIIEMAAVY